MVAVSPTAGPRDSVCTYRLSPANLLPTLDLSLSIESRFLSHSALARMRRFVRKRALIGLSAWIALTAYFVAMLAPAHIGRVFGVVAFVLWTPAFVASFALLRVDVVWLLMTTHDFWFSTFVNASTYCVLGVLLGDARAGALVAASSGVQMSITVDANLRAVKVWAVLNAIGVFCSSATWVAVSLALVDDMHDTALLRTETHELRASMFVSSGLLTVVALVTRNVYRQRAVFSKRVNRAVVECVSYRVNLRLSSVSPVRQSTRPHAAAAPSHEVAAAHAAPPEFLKQMQYVPQLGEIDARRTLLQLPVVSDTDNAPPRVTAALQALGAFALVACGLTSGVSFEQRPDPAAIAGLVLALALTAFYCAVYAAHYQRELLRALFGSFDFILLYALLLFAHVCACDFFSWQPHCVLRAAASWLWLQWSLCLDAVPPAMRYKLGARKPFAVAALALFTGSSGAFLYMVMSAKPATRIVDRVVWDPRALGVALQLRLVPVFFNCSSAALSLLARLLWRAAANPSDVLLVLDGAVVYENYLRTATNRLSRRWGSRELAPDPQQQRRQRTRFYSVTPKSFLRSVRVTPASS
ncbi:hypothetical protein PybrP1_005098 [[Pythium] brassicae (nom. inval.)]|nr:hypothetical protein PybrP1_005098 [[Pythium] brassicae (nom. inval.)]